MEHLDLEKIAVDAMDMTNFFLTKLRQNGYVIPDMREMIEETNSVFADFLFEDLSWPIELRKTALRWSCDSAAAAVVGTRSVLAPTDHDTLQSQIVNLGKWEVFAGDIVHGALSRLDVIKKTEDRLASKKHAPRKSSP